MSGSGEHQRLQAEDEAAEAAEVVEISSTGRQRSEKKTPRRCVQTKLNFFVSPQGRGRDRGSDNEEDEDEEEEPSWSGDEGKKKRKRKRKTQSRTPNKAPVISKEAVGWNIGNKKLLHTVGDGSDFFLKVSEKRLKRKHQREQEDVVDLTVEGDTCSKASQTMGKKSHGQLKIQQLDFTPCKDLVSSDPKGPDSRWWLTSGNSSTAKDAGGQDVSECHPTMNPCPESNNTEEGNVHTYATRPTHPFFSRWKTTKRVSEFSHIAKVNKNYFSTLDEDMLMSEPPIHVFEALQDDSISLDWGHWKISERSSLDLSEAIAPQSNLSTVSDALITPLKFDSTIPFSNMSGSMLLHEEMDLDQIQEQAVNLFAGSEGSSAFSADRQETHNQHVSYLHMFQGTQENILSSRCTGSLDNLENVQQERQSRERLSLYQLHRDCYSDCSLWTNKYRPDKTVEVCGNGESVRFLFEWLKSWQERHLQTIKSSMSSNVYIKDDSDDSSYQNTSDSEDEDEVPHRNVLLVTGPVGCGKSAAIYACAKEQGFQVIEVNASDERNGAHIKQKFGEAMDSHGIELCSTEDAIELRRKQPLPLVMESSVNTVAEFKHGDLKEDSRLHKATRNTCPVNAVDNQSSTCRVANKNLFLFEDVDIVFDEDRGFIATIMQLAEASKRPIILTANSKNPILPRALNKLVVEFTRPSTEELLTHMLMICAAEGAHASPLLLKDLIRSCQGDIRKTILLLQLWCLGERGQTGRNFQFAYSPLLFDLDAAHSVITKVIPCAIPCELSLKVEEEISKTVSALAENQEIMHSLMEEDDMTETIDASNISEEGAGTNVTMENTMVHSKCLISQHVEFSSPSRYHGDFSDDSGSPLTFARRRVKHRTDTVLSSQSGDVLAADTTIHIRSPEATSFPSPDACASQSCQPIDHANYLNPLDDLFGERANLSRDPFTIGEIASTSHVSDTYISACIPESSLLPDTEISNRQGCLSAASNAFSTDLEDFLMSNIALVQDLSQAEVNNIRATISATHDYPINELENIRELDAESVHGNEEPGVSQKESATALSRGCQLMDECSRAGFGLESMPVDNTECYPIVVSVEETWRRLRNFHEDLKSYVTSHQKDARKIIDLTSGLTDLISEADILLRSCESLTRDVLEPSSIPFDETCSSSWCDGHLEMASTFAQHGLCFYASEAARVQSNLGYEISIYLAQEMLATSTSSMAPGKLLSQKKRTIGNLYAERGLLVESSRYSIPLRRELESKICDALHPIIPARLYMVLKGPAFHEYVSFLSCMSKSENSRLSEDKDKFQRHQRIRVSRHYLRSYPFALSPEDVALLAEYSCFGGVDFR